MNHVSNEFVVKVHEGRVVGCHLGCIWVSMQTILKVLEGKEITDLGMIYKVDHCSHYLLLF